LILAHNHPFSGKEQSGPNLEKECDYPDVRQPVPVDGCCLDLHFRLVAGLCRAMDTRAFRAKTKHRVPLLLFLSI
jgi:hypothetical protein